VVSRRTMCGRSSTFHFVILDPADSPCRICLVIPLCSFERPIYATRADLYGSVS
jgi:hypothetical protein